MRRRGILGLVLAGACLAASGAASAEKRVALVVGNSAYVNTTPLPNPKHDAADVSAALKRLGFEVIDGLDLDKRAFERLIRQFALKLAGADVALFFYAGHGLQIAGQNYLVPTDAKLEAEGDVDFESLPLLLVLKQMEREAKTSLILLDACRDNPLARNLARTMGTRSGQVGQGLAEVRTGIGTLIGFSTQPGNVALDGTGRNSPYAAALLAHIETPDKDVSATLVAVRNDVVRATSGKQVPWEHTSLMGPVAFKAREAAAPPPGGQTHGSGPVLAPLVSEAAREWAAVDKSSEVELRTFIERHGGSPQAAYAKARLAAIAQEKEAAAAVKKAEDEAQAAKKQELAMLAQAEKKRAEEDRKAKEAAEAERKRKDADAFTPGRVFRDCEEKDKAGNFICPEMVVVPSGEFSMGSEDGGSDEKPVRKVTIAKPFAVGKFEVTFSEWDACVAAGGCKTKPGDQGWGRGRQPVMSVSWDDITKEYLPWLSKKTGKTYRLLSEAEWEYAARAGTETKYTFGDVITKQQAQFSEGEWGSAKQTVEVGKFPANNFGLHDLHGNVWEWVEDCYQDSYNGAPTDGAARKTTGNCSARVLRGGSWFNDPQGLRSALRGWSTTGSRGNDLGFRVGRTLTP